MYDIFRAFTRDEYRKYLNAIKISNPKLAKYANISDDDDDEDAYIDSVIEDQFLSKREFVEITAIYRRRNYSKLYGGANQAAENETDRLYAKNPWKFVEEFLQNADDCSYLSAPEIHIRIDERDETHPFIEFIYNEEGFSRRDVWALTLFSESTKVNDLVKGQEASGVFYREKTGRKGKGFKSVFSLDAENVIVHIRSNGFCFKLDNSIGRILPIWEEDHGRMDGKTHIIVELIRPGFSVAEIYPEFRRLFCVDDFETLFAKSPFLFMHRIRTVQVTQIHTDGSDSFITEYRENEEKTEYRNPFQLAPDKMVLSGIAKDGIYYREQTQSGKISTLSEDGKDVEIPLVRFTRMVEDDESYRNYSIIAPLIRNDSAVSWKGGALFRTFPLSLHPLNLPVAIDAPFILNPDRSGIQYSPYKDAEEQSGPANKWNGQVVERLFEKGGIFESFLLWLRSLEGIRTDRYLSKDATVLFDDARNSDGHGNHWIPHMDIGKLYFTYPLFRLFANDKGYVSLDDAKIVNRELYRWPCAEMLFTFMIGEHYREQLLSDLYIGSPLFQSCSIVGHGFADSMNSYLDIVERELGLESEQMAAFVNGQLYPYLKNNYKLISQKEENAFDKLCIYFSKITEQGNVSIRREAHTEHIKWYHAPDGNAPLSINKYRVFESSPVNINLIHEITTQTLGTKSLYIDFGERNQRIIAKNLKTWDAIRDYIEAVCHFGFSSDTLHFEHLQKYVLSESLDPEFNAFRASGLLRTLNEQDVAKLSRYFQNDIVKTASALKRMGIKSGKDYFISEGNYLRFKKDTLAMLGMKQCPVEVLDDICQEKMRQNKDINATYKEIKTCREDVLLFFLNERNRLFSSDVYAGICGEVQENPEFRSRTDANAAEILIRACAGATRRLKNNDSRSITTTLEEVLRRNLEDCIIVILSKNAIKQICIVNNGYFEEIPAEEILPRIKLLNPDRCRQRACYYKGNLARFGGNKRYLTDGGAGHVFLQQDETGDYIDALEESLKSSFDAEKLRYVAEIERQYQNVKEDLIGPLFEETGRDLNRTYLELEKRFSEYGRKQIICILSWFRYQGYQSAFGNGNINNEKEIADDYRDSPWKFVYEFIQNVDDCSFGDKKPELKLTICKEKNQVIFEYNEEGFTLDDIMALTQFGSSNKRDHLEKIPEGSGVFFRRKTGHKGRGFKSVFSLPGDGIIVHICSNGFTFKFIKKLGYIIPVWEDLSDAPEKGTRVIVEGFTDNYLDTLIPQVRKLFGVDDLSKFFAICPVFFLRKLKTVSVITDNEVFSVDIEAESKALFANNIFQVNGKPVASGIIVNGEYRKALWERLVVTVTALETRKRFSAVKYSRMFMNDGEASVGSIFAPVIRSNVDAVFQKGALYSTLPLEGHTISIPLSIQAPFLTNSGRSAIEDTKKNVDIIRFAFGPLLRGLFMQLRKLNSIQIKAYIPAKEERLFEHYKNIESVDLHRFIRSLEIIKRYDGADFLSCDKAAVLPAECYEWAKPEILCQCFGCSPSMLAAKEGIGIASKRDLISNSFVSNLNEYLDQINMGAASMASLLRNHIYPYIGKNYNRLRQFYRADFRQEMSKLRIFLFLMADGSTVREHADANLVWVEHMPEQYRSFGKYRSIESSSIYGIGFENDWVKELHPTVEFDSAFSEDYLKTGSANSWEKAKTLIETLLYYDIRQEVSIPFLSDCVLSEELDSGENLFRTGYLKTGNSEILKRVINRDDLERIRLAACPNTALTVDELALFVQKKRLKRPDDFFQPDGKSILTLNHSTLALLRNYCRNNETASRVLAAIHSAFQHIQKQRDTRFNLTYEDLADCAPVVFSRFFEYEIGEKDMRVKIAKALCSKSTFPEIHDGGEAFLRALSLAGETPGTCSIRLPLSEIIDRRMGSCVQNCILKVKSLTLTIETDIEAEVYASDEIQKVLKWLDDSDAVNASIKYYTADLSGAFPNTRPGERFLFDADKVILDAAAPENCMNQYVQERYRGKDDGFRDLIRIKNEQNDLMRRPWPETKKKYVEKLAAFRGDSWRKRELLFPNYDNYLDEATRNSLDYVLPELLQNINDCGFGPDQAERTLDVEIDMEQCTMLLRYDEAGFDFDNVYSITAIGMSSKHDEQEGEKGLGFKKVLSLFDSVEIYSNDFCFSLSKKKNTVPKWIESRERRQKYLAEGKTTMLFTADHTKKSKLEAIRKQWESLMNGQYVGTGISPLFLDHIDRIRLAGCQMCYERRRMEDSFVYVREPLLKCYAELLCENDAPHAEAQLAGLCEKLRSRRKCALMAPEDQDRYLENITVSLCVLRKAAEKSPAKGCFFSTLPTEHTFTPSLWINLPLELTTGRDEIRTDSGYNRAILRALFTPCQGGPSVFGRLLERMARDNAALFLPNFLAQNLDDFAKSATELAGVAPGTLLSGVRKAWLLWANRSQELVSVDEGYSVDRIICLYLKEVGESVNNIEDWMRSHTEKAKNKKLVLPVTVEACEKLESYAKTLNVEDGYFPLAEDGKDLTVEYLTEEYDN
ncbi:MAG: hypothetical protein IJ601_10020 [Acidaminococcaceae bacterium]|nr:hypothetical protein [Acidaminococcaceae bacterium]